MVPVVIAIAHRGPGDDDCGGRGSTSVNRRCSMSASGDALLPSWINAQAHALVLANIAWSEWQADADQLTITKLALDQIQGRAQAAHRGGDQFINPERVSVVAMRLRLDRGRQYPRRA